MFHVCLRFRRSEFNGSTFTFNYNFLCFPNCFQFFKCHAPSSYFSLSPERHFDHTAYKNSLWWLHRKDLADLSVHCAQNYHSFDIIRFLLKVQKEVQKNALSVSAPWDMRFHPFLGMDINNCHSFSWSQFFKHRLHWYYTFAFKATWPVQRQLCSFWENSERETYATTKVVIFPFYEMHKTFCIVSTLFGRLYLCCFKQFYKVHQFC